MHDHFRISEGHGEIEVDHFGLVCGSGGKGKNKRYVTFLIMTICLKFSARK